MKLIRLDEFGKPYQFNLPDLKAEHREQSDQEQQSSKQERINKMLEAQGKSKTKTDIDFHNYLEMGYIYATVSGYEYIKMDLNEFWSFVNVLNALASIDSDELGFYGINLYVPKSNNTGTSSTIELVSFEFYEHSNTVLGMCDALASGTLSKENLNEFFNLIRYLG